MGKPNIVFICTDDQAPWALGLSGNAQALTPNLDRLFREGAYLTNSFTTTPVCSPSRAGTMVSRYGSELGITDWLNSGAKHLRDESDVGLDPHLVAWPKVLSQAGYRTGLVGKWHCGSADAFHPQRHGFGYFAGFRGGSVSVKDPLLEVEGEKRKYEGLEVDVLADLALEFLRQSRERQPFLLNLHFRSPHHPWLPLDLEDWAPYADMKPVLPNPDYPNLDLERLDVMMREYLASVTGVDRNVGRVLAGLEELGVADNTLVIHTSDHGYNMGHNGIWHKGNGHWITRDVRDLPDYDERVARPNLYDNSIRVPTGIRWPGVVKPGSVITETVSHLDWYPTILAAVGSDVPKDQVIRGRSFLPLLRDERPAWDNDFYAEYSQHHYTRADLRMYRTPEWKLVRDFLRPGHDELYHLATDPAESENLIDDPATKDVQAKLDAQLREKMRSLGDSLGEVGEK